MIQVLAGDPEVDRESGMTMATASAPVIYISKVEYWNPATGAYQSTYPTVNPGQTIGLRITVQNDGSETLVTRVDIRATAPDGGHFTLTGSNQWIDPGSSASWGFSWTADVPGDYWAYIDLYSGWRLEYIRFIEMWTETIAMVEVVPAGAITGYTFWNPDTGTYQTSAPTILVGQEAGVRGQFQNTSGATQRMKMEGEVTDPDGDKTTLPGSWAESVADGQVMYWESDKFTCDKVGTYKVTLILYAELV